MRWINRKATGRRRTSPSCRGSSIRVRIAKCDGRNWPDGRSRRTSHNELLGSSPVDPRSRLSGVGDSQSVAGNVSVDLTTEFEARSQSFGNWDRPAAVVGRNTDRRDRPFENIASVVGAGCDCLEIE